MLLRDANMSHKLNLNNIKDDDIAQDWYMYITLKVQEYLSKIKDDSAQKLSNIIIHRDMVKKCIMIIPYNAGTLTKLNEVINLFNKKDDNYYYYKNNSDIKLTYDDILLLVISIHKVILKEYPRIKDFTIYLKQIAKICSVLEIPTPWVLPNGLHIKQFYLDEKTIKISSSKFMKTNYSVKLFNNNKSNKSKNMIALMPNLVHSLDANSLSLLINRLYTLYNFSGYFLSIIYI